jgi:hypothetical protein
MLLHGGKLEEYTYCGLNPNLHGRITKKKRQSLYEFNPAKII